MKLTYRAFDKAGHEVSDTLEASDRAQATRTLRSRGLYVTELAEAAAGTARAGTPARRVRRRRQKLKDLAMFTRQLYVLVHSGTPLVEALGALARQTRPGPWRDTIADIRTTVEEGAPLGEAMAAHPDRFDAVCCSLVTVGEARGNLAPMLDRLTKLTQKRIQVRNSIVGALIYPCLLMTVALTVLGLLLGFVIPRFAELFRTLDVPLPGSTKAMIVLSGALRAGWWALAIVVVGAAVGLKMYLGSPAGKRAYDAALLRVPKIGGIVRNFVTARITRLLGVLLDGHVPVLEALKLARSGAGNIHYAELVAQAEEAVSRGETISSVFAQSNLISPSVSECIRSGEQSAQVGSLLLSIADFLDEENDVVVRTLTSILEPAILILMGILVGFVALSMFMPLFDLTAIAGGGAA